VTESWRRPYPLGYGRLVVVLWELLALALFGWRTLRLLAELVSVHPAAGWALSAGLAALWATGSWRIVRLGVYVGDRGLRIQGLVRSRVLDWSEIALVSVHDPVRRTLGFEVSTGQTVLIGLRTGEMVGTPLFAKGIDFVFRPGAFQHAYRSLRSAFEDRSAPATA